MCLDHFYDAFRVCQDVIIPESQNIESLRIQPGFSFFVFLHVHCMLPAVYFDDNPRLETYKVGDIRTYWLLASELEPAQLF